METGADRRFALEVHDFEGNDLAPGDRDTVTFMIQAVLPVTTTIETTFAFTVPTGRAGAGTMARS
jgi:hypothetical protein